MSGRLAMFAITVWLAITVVFFLPRLTGQNPLEERIYQEAAQGGYLDPNVQERVRVFEEKYGFDQPLWRQYTKFVTDVLQFDLGRSILRWPKSVNEIMAESILWTVSLSLLTLILSFLLGTLMGALMEWRRQDVALMSFMAPFLILSAIPFFIFGILLQTLVFSIDRTFPTINGYQTGVVGWPDWSDWGFLMSVLQHALLPSLSIVLVSLGGWAMGMRGMMVTTKGEDYMLNAEAKGLPGRVRFYRYAMRNSALPQVTGLVLNLGLIVSGLLLVEIVFAYPGLGNLLYDSIRNSDYPTIQGVTFILALGTALATLLIDMTYPLIDPRIRARG